MVDGSLDRVAPVEPMDFPLPPGGLAIRRVDGVLAQEERLHEHKLPAVVAWLAANRLDRLITTGGAAAKLGIVTAGKPYLDVRQALDALGLDEARCDALGLRLYKLACVWPVEPEGLKAFAAGLDADRRRRGEARADRDAVARNPLWRRPSARRRRQARRGGRMAAAEQGRARSADDRRRDRRATGEAFARSRARGGVGADQGDARRSGELKRSGDAHALFLLRLPAQPLDRSCRKARAPTPASAAISWRCSWTAPPRASPRWAAKARTGSAKRISRPAAMCSRISATAPTTIPARSPCAGRSTPRSTSPTRSCSTTRWR